MQHCQSIRRGYVTSKTHASWKSERCGTQWQNCFSYLQCTQYRPCLHSSCTRVVHSWSWTSESYGWFRRQGRQSRSVPSITILQSTAANQRSYISALISRHINTISGFIIIGFERSTAQYRENISVCLHHHYSVVTLHLHLN